MEKQVNKKGMKQGPQDIALVLSSGGARGLAHIGAIEELISRNYRITSVTGCSMGALVGGMYAAGRLDDFKQWMCDLDRQKMWKLTDLSFSLTHLMKGERIIEAMKDVVPDVDITDLKIPYCAVAADWETGREIVFREGSLYEAIRASISMPAVFSPVRRGEMILVDGGVINPLPLSQAVRGKNELLVAVNVSGPDFEGRSIKRQKREEEENRQIEARLAKKKAIHNPIRRSLSYFPSPSDLLERLRPDDLSFNYITLIDRAMSIAIKQNAALALQLYKPDIVADIELADFDSFDYDKARQIINLGKQSMQQALKTYSQPINNA